MPKVIDYPRDSLAKCIELAKAVDSLGGSSTADTCAEKMGRRVSGGFGALVGAAVKFGLVEVSKSRITTTDLYKTYKHAYSPEEERSVLQTAMLNVPVFASLIERFDGKKVPEEMLARILVREFNVREQEAGRVANFFLEGVSAAGILQDTDGVIAVGRRSVDSSVGKQSTDESPVFSKKQTPANDGTFFVSVRGPGVNAEIEVADLDDIQIVEVYLKKIRKRLAEIEGGKD